MKDLLFEIGQEHDLDTLLSRIVHHLAERSDQVALARIWLAEPGDSCPTCRNSRVCVARDRCLHLVASVARPRAGGLMVDRRLEGAFRRIPIGAFKVGRVFASRAPLVVTDTSADPQFASPEWARAEGVVAFGGAPLVSRGEILGVLGVFTRVALTPTAMDVLRILATQAGGAIAGARSSEQLARLQRRLGDDRRDPPEGIAACDAGRIVGSSASIHHVRQQIDLVASTDSTVLITGESGTGKELVAEQIHRLSRRAEGPFVPVNCAAVPRELYESEFFGHARGAFSGAVRQRVGRFEVAEGGTLFLDEVGEIPMDLQGKLLRVLQESTFERVGETSSRRASVRIVAATNRDLLGAIADGQFRADLYYRLNVFPIETPPLRARREDIALIAVHLVQAVCRRMHRPPPALDSAALAMLEAYDWPGNVRELHNVLERAVISTPRGAEHLHIPALAPGPLPPRSLAPRSPLVEHDASSSAPAILTDEEIKRLGRDNLLAALRVTAGRIAGPGGAAALLGIKPSTLTSRLRKLGIDPSQARQVGSAKQAG